MEDPTAPIARILLARSLPRLLAVPLMVALAGAAAIAAGLLTAAGTTSIALIALGAVVVVGGIAGAVVLLSVRFEVEESAVALVWIGGRRVYALAAGPVTRVRLRGRSASKLRPRSGALGWGIGRARLRDEEEIDLIRLAATRTAILIPTEHRRLAVAPDRDDELLDALAKAARARQRTEAATEAAAAEPEVDPSADVVPSSLTGIERALLEERLARERDEAEAVRRAEVAAAGAVPAETVPEVTTEPVSQRSRPALGMLRPATGWTFVLLPTAAAAATWWAGRTFGVLPESGSDLARLTLLALVLAGPATSVGAVMALAWWPRLVGVVVGGGLIASAFIGRALIG